MAKLSMANEKISFSIKNATEGYKVERLITWDNQDGENVGVTEEISTSSQETAIIVANSLTLTHSLINQYRAYTQEQLGALLNLRDAIQQCEELFGTLVSDSEGSALTGASIVGGGVVIHK